MTQNHFIGLLLILLFAFAVGLLTCIEKLNNLGSSIISAEGKLKKDSIVIRSLKELIFTYSTSIDIKLERNLPLYDVNNQHTSLQKLITRKKLIYYFNETNCLICVEKYLPFLEDLSSRLGRDNVLIIGSFENPRKLFLTLEKYATQIPAYNLKSAYLKDQKISGLNTPYIFEIDSILTVNNVFIPEKGLPELSELYTENIIQRN